MLDIDNKEVIAAQVAGSYATDTNRSRTRTNIEITSTAYFVQDDGSSPNSYYFVPARITEGKNSVRNSHIVVILGDNSIIGCFLR